MDESETAFNDSIESTSKFLTHVGSCVLVSCALFDNLPAPFAATGLLLGVISKQLQVNSQARSEWSSLLEELTIFEEELSGGAGYLKLLEEMIQNEELKKGDPQSDAFVIELKTESVKMNEILRSLLVQAKGFFGDSAELKKIFKANTHKAAAEKASQTLSRFRESIKGKTDRYSNIQVSMIAQRVLKMSFKEVKHQKFRNMWDLNSWTAQVPIVEFVAQVRANSTCTADTIERFQTFLLSQHDDGKLNLQSINALTAKLDDSLDLEATVLAITPKKINLADSLKHPAFHALWMYGENAKRFTSTTVSLAAFEEMLVAHGVESGQDILVPANKLMKLLRARQSTDTINLSDLAVVSEGLDPMLTLRGTVLAVIALIEAELPTPPPSPVPGRVSPVPVTESGFSTPTKSTAHYNPDTPVSELKYAKLETSLFTSPMEGSPQRGVCARCGANFAFVGKGTATAPYSPGKKMKDHVCK